MNQKNGWVKTVAVDSDCPRAGGTRGVFWFSALGRSIHAWESRKKAMLGQSWSTPTVLRLKMHVGICGPPP